MNVRRRLIPAAAAASLGLGALTACSSDSAAKGNTEKFDVVASFYPMAFLAEQIGGDHANVTSLTEPGQEPHDLEISTQQRAQLEEADAALFLKGLQPAVDEAVTQTGIETKIDAASLTHLEDHGGAGHSHEGEEAHSGESEEEEHGRDPHVWLDPVKYAEIAQGVGKAFEKADPDHAADYKKNTEALVKKLNGLNSDFENGLKDSKSKVFFTNHAAFGYLAERYGLTQEAISGVDPESEPSAARVKELQQEAKADGVTTVFYETLVSDRTAKTLARDADLKTDVLDPLEGITDKSRGDDYFQVMEANLKALQTALGAK
ncbi:MULTISPECIES: metal ABC transporter substrate-binding protein [Streptomyces]|uniref:Zinc ABC transporter substrate-binding protein n=1 Tax=Streptomyces koelreuteriae TaxID=2838015 RepID=A0ABX8FXD5_9ACTN|nr:MULTISPECIES: metal ABC transporter substrate-binding protein [Streptomyces]QWB25736.1 zinc ABC transporter substrate-binding protein [Streptomyces koelreuteriae]UUA08794.1 metal ABC transporter substrate-binding protein [Streptomyces koelreuteriae]UUA16399.1 metal ABC transporter substrate-binding protein [Streptomyces sp. CRCS-T-1]